MLYQLHYGVYQGFRLSLGESIEMIFVSILTIFEVSNIFWDIWDSSEKLKCADKKWVILNSNDKFFGLISFLLKWGLKRLEEQISKAV